VHKIIERTALFIRDAGQEQLEKLRASQTDNPAFSFLSLSGPLHPYFLFLTKSERNRSQQVILSKLGKSKQRIQPTLPTRSENQQNTTISKPALSLNVELSTSSPQQSSSKVSGKKALIPPHRLKLIIDKFISFVGKHGIQFAYKVRDKEKQNPDFDFLLPWDKYHDYYTEQLAILTAKKEQHYKREKKIESSKKNIVKEEEEFDNAKNIGRKIFVQEFPVGNEEPSVTSPSSPSRNKPIEETTINVADYGIEGDYVKKEEEKTKKKKNEGRKRS